jgi:4-hydroxy-tetrahydrodipicolinate reductase
MIRAAVSGIAGRMGRAIGAELLERNHVLGAAFESADSPHIGKDASSLLGGEALNVPVRAANPADLAKVDGIIDFTFHTATMALLPLVIDARKPLVIGTTGFDEDERARIEYAAADIPVLLAPNMSLGVNVLFKLTEIASRALAEDFDIELFEAHHRFKKDAPSGTAHHLLAIIKDAVPRLADAPVNYDRSRAMAARAGDEIGVMVMRGGDIVGEHTLYFNGSGERIELTHRAQSREIFARGAVRALEYLADRGPGLYSMFDVLGI